MSFVKDKTGKRYGKLLVIEFKGTVDGTSLWECECECGNRTVVRSYNLTSGHTLSCGCVKRERSRHAHTIHGKYGTRLYKIWRGMIQRCRDTNYPSYKYYGGRGIDVCRGWSDFNAFEKWALDNGYDERASRGVCTLDRKDNEKGYSPDNCRWVTYKKQMRNVRTNRLITYGGVTKTMVEWAETRGLSESTLHARLNKLGWSVERALNTPIGKNRRE